jgi:hypothetical protein
MLTPVTSDAERVSHSPKLDLYSVLTGLITRDLLTLVTERISGEFVL